jgi:F-type H+-transporting ATPase subunit epsilon
MAETITLELVTPERKVLTETVDQVVLPGSEGSLGVLPGHAPLLTMLGEGELTWTRDGQTHHLAASGGYAEILPERVIVLAATAERAEEIDAERAKAKVSQYEEEIRQADPGTDVDVIQHRIRKHLTRVQVAGHR